MPVQPIDWAAVAAPTVLGCAAVVVLVVGAFAGPPRTRRAAHLPTALTLVAVGVAAVPLVALWGDSRSTFCVVAPASEAPGRCSFGVDGLTLVVWAVVLFGTAVVALIGTAEVADGRTPMPEWCFLLLCSATGALTIAAARDLVTLVVALEVVSLPAFALVGLRHGDRPAAEASLKFFLVSVTSTAVTLMGVSLVYGASGTVFLGPLNTLDASSPTYPVAVTGILLTVVGLAFKVAAVPFHMWVPDTYVGAPVAVAAYLSVVSKAAGFVGLLLVLQRGAAGLTDAWAPVLGVLAALTMTVGNVLALRQSHAVRLLAWSSVAQAGYVLVPFAVSAHDPGHAAGATAGYLAVYAVVNLGAFAVAALVGTRHPAQRLADYRGLVREEPGAGWALAFALVALAGLPPGVVGLLAKVVVLDAAAGPATWLAVVMALNVAVGLVYYVRWLRELFAAPVTEGASRYDVPNGVAAAIGMTLTAGVVLSVLPGLLLDPVLSALG
jgi:NADH-quinone oxidoreductase subunit N